MTDSPPTTERAHQLYLALLQAASDLNTQAGELLRQHGLSGPQYNVLRILRGAGQPLNCSAISEQLLNRDPDVTRLLDRLEKQGLISRSRDQADRRVVTSQLTDAGLEVLTTLDQPMLKLHQQQFAALDDHQAAQLLELLKQLRG